MDAGVLADEVAALISKMGKGPYLVLCAALKSAGGEVVIETDELARDAVRLSPRVEVATDAWGVVVRLSQ